jgi:hypothetical protein
MSEQQVKAGQVNESEEVLDAIFASSEEAAEVMHPGNEPLHFPAFSIAAQFAVHPEFCVCVRAGSGRSAEQIVLSIMEILALPKEQPFRGQRSRRPDRGYPGQPEIRLPPIAKRRSFCACTAVAADHELAVHMLDRVSWRYLEETGVGLLPLQVDD